MSATRLSPEMLREALRLLGADHIAEVAWEDVVLRRGVIVATTTSDKLPVQFPPNRGTPPRKPKKGGK